MKIKNEHILVGLLGTMGIVTFLNVLIMYWIPVFIPLSSFVAIRVTVLAFVEKSYGLIGFSLLVCLILFLTIISIRRRQILLPGLSLVYFICEFFTILNLIIDGLYDGYWKTYIIQLIVAVILIVLLFIYCWSYKTTRSYLGSKKG